MELSDLLPKGAPSFELSTPTCSRQSSLHIPQKISWGTPIPPPSSLKTATVNLKETLLDNIELHAKGTDSVKSRNSATWNTLDNIAALGLSFTGESAHTGETPKKERFSLEDVESFANRSLPVPLEPERPFNKWVKNLERRATNRRKTVSCDMGVTIPEKVIFESPASQRRSGHKKSSSGSSFGFVTAMKSASISLASFSVAPRSKRTGVSSRHQRADRSTTASNLGRASEDSSFIARGLVIDQAVTDRLVQRRRILEELISTEEGYMADVKFLMNVYVTLLASIPSLSVSLRASINRNLNEILELHEELLGDLHRVVPHSEYTQTSCASSLLNTPASGHQRWRSLDAVPEHSGGPNHHTWLQKIPGMTAEPQIAAEVARVFGKKMNRFFVYEEYGAKYEIMIKDVASAYRTIPQWEVYQKGLEALASSLASINNQQDNAKKSMTIGDLLVKPIQRVCRYPLLFSELLKQTPVCDCPDSHLEIENVLIRLREATTEINRATDDPRMKSLLEKTWLLQDRLALPDAPDSRSRNAIRALGHIHLCGVLHVSWQTLEGVDGQYLICLLYRDFLLLASAPMADQIYTVQACIALSEVDVEEVDNGRGLQCHTAPFSWKVIFECDHQLFELTMSACSPKEELEWRSRLVDHSGRDVLNAGEHGLFTSLSLAIKPLGTVFGKPGTIARRISIHRATTVGAMSGLCQVIIKNTNAFKDTSSSAAINRSQSLLTTNRIPVLAPSRAERMRLEALLADVWTREVLPFPGMTSRARSEHLVRASAHSMMRKLSVASITSNFTKRSGSMASLHKYAEEDGSGEYEPKGTPARAEHNSTDNKSEPDDLGRSRLSVIQDERENAPQKDSFENLTALAFGLTGGSPQSTMRPFVSLRGKKSWQIEGHRMVTPPLRTSSANSFSQSHIKIAPLPTITDAGLVEEKENISQSGRKEAEGGRKRARVIGKGRSVVAEGLRNFFR